MCLEVQEWASLQGCGCLPQERSGVKLKHIVSSYRQVCLSRLARPMERQVLHQPMWVSLVFNVLNVFSRQQLELSSCPKLRKRQNSEVVLDLFNSYLQHATGRF